MRDGDYFEPSKQPLRVYLENWLTSVEATRKPSTAGMYAHKMRRYVIPRIGGMPLRQVDAPTLEALYAELRERRTLRQVRRADALVRTNGGRRAPHPASRSLQRSTPRTHSRNPATIVEPPKSTAPRAMQVWDAEQMRRFVEHVADDRLRALWILTATTGMRRGEVCGLMWSDVNLDAGQLAVARSRVPISGKVVESTPKLKEDASHHTRALRRSSQRRWRTLVMVSSIRGSVEVVC